jgi:hypothetical protein
LTIIIVEREKVNLRELLLEEHSKKRAQYICDGIIAGKANIGSLLELLYHGDIWMRQRSSWPLELVALSNEELIHPYLSEIMKVLKDSTEDAVTRNLYRALQHMHFTEETIGPMYDIAFMHLANPQSAIAIQVFAMTVCSNIAHQFPELSEELIPLIEDQMIYGSAGYRSRAKRELKRLYKINKSLE